MGQSKSIKVSRYPKPIAGFKGYAEFPGGAPIVFFDGDGGYLLFDKRDPDGGVASAGVVITASDLSDLLRLSDAPKEPDE